jgi:hypothetical protein
MLSSSGSFDRCIERKDIGLKRNVINNFNDSRNILG